MRFLTLMKCLLTASLCMTAASGISNPVYASYGSGTVFYLLPLSYADMTQYLPFTEWQLDLTDTLYYEAVDVSDIKLMPVDGVSPVIEINGVLTGTFDGTESGTSSGSVGTVSIAGIDSFPSGSTINVLVYTGTDSSGRFTVQSFPLNASGSWYPDLPNMIGVISVDIPGVGTVDLDETNYNGTLSGTMEQESGLSFSLPANSGYLYEYEDDAAKVAKIEDLYSGYVRSFTGWNYGCGFAFSPNRPGRVGYPYGFFAGSVNKYSFWVSTSSPPSVDQFTVLSGTQNLPITVYLGRVYVRNYGTAEMPQLEYVSELCFDLSPVANGSFSNIRILMSSGINWFSAVFNSQMIDSDVAVVSKLQELLTYYSANPPEADDARAQAEMNDALEEAALQDAESSLESLQASVSPSSPLPGVQDLTLSGAVTSWADMMTVMFSVFPWMLVLVTLVFFLYVVKAFFT